MAVVHHVGGHEDELRHLVGLEVSLEVVEGADGPEAGPVVGDVVVGYEGARRREVSCQFPPVTGGRLQCASAETYLCFLT